MIIFGVRLPNTDIYHYQLDGGTADDLHGHDHVHQVSLPLVGHASLQLDTEKRDLTEDLRVVTSPGHRHRNFAGRDRTRLLVVNLRPRLVDAVYREHTGHDAPVEFASWSRGTSDAIRRHADWMLRRWSQAPGELLETDEWEVELARLLLNLHEGSHADRWRGSRLAADHPGLRRALARMHDEFDQDLSLDDLAAAARVSKSHLIRLFHGHLGKTPSQYLAELRLAQAAKLLTRTGQSVTEVAFACGFGSLSTFERAFRQRHGMSAGAYRRAAQ